MLKINPLETDDKKTTKDLVINILSYRYPLSKMQIYNELRKRSGVTFHALNKAVNQLTEAKILEKTGKNYRINYNWVYSLNKFSEHILSKLQDSKGCLIHGVRDIKEEGNVTTLSFDSIADMDKYCKSLHEHYYSSLNENEKVCIVYDHHWWHIFYPEQEYQAENVNKRFYCICTKNTPLDKVGIKYKIKLGMNAKFNPRIHFRNVIVYGDTLVENVMCIELNKALDNFFRGTRSLDNLDVIKFKQILKKKGKVIVVVNKNREIAEEIKKEVLANFKV